MKIKHWIKTAQDSLKETDSPRLDAQLLLAHTLQQNRAWIIANTDFTIPKEALVRLEHMLQLRKKRIPLAQILGLREFYGRTFTINENVLVPRPETEVLVEQAVKTIPQNASVLEIGTGSGCISVSLSLERPDLSIVATDISTQALEIAIENAKNLNATVTFIESDLFKSIKEGQTFDVVLANLPYVPINARRQPEIEHEPDVALYSGDDGLNHYRKFFAKLQKYLSPDGICFVEYSPTQHHMVRDLLSQYTLSSEPISEYIYKIS